MTLVKPKADAREAWQYTGEMSAPPWPMWPAWVISSTRWNDANELVLNRMSGPQVVNVTDWLVRDLDSRDPDWLTHDQMRKTFDEVAP